MELKGICNYETRCTLFAVLLLHDHTCLFRVHQKKHRLFGFSSCPDRGNGKKRHKKLASFAIWGLPHVQASLEQAEHHLTLFLCCLFLGCVSTYFWELFRARHLECCLSAVAIPQKSTKPHKCSNAETKKIVAYF